MKRMRTARQRYSTSPTRRAPATNPAGKACWFPAAVTALAAALSGCGGVAVRLQIDEAAAPGAASEPRTLCFRRDARTMDRYQATYKIRLRNANQMDDDFTADVFFQNIGKVDEKGHFDKVVIHRVDRKRRYMEVTSNGKRTSHERKRSTQPEVTLNRGPVPNTRLFFIPYDKLGRIGRRPETNYNFVHYDSLCYVFPVLAGGEVSLGDRWTYDMPVVVEQSKVPIDLHVRFRFADVRKVLVEKGIWAVCAVIRYDYYAIMDTDNPADAGKLPANQAVIEWQRQLVEGEGQAYFWIKEGKVVWKRERYTVTRELRTSIDIKKPDPKDVESFFDAPRRGGKGPRQHRWTMTVEFDSRLRLDPRAAATDRPDRLK